MIWSVVHRESFCCDKVIINKMADSDDIDLYAILGVSKRASIADIKKVRTERQL